MEMEKIVETLKEHGTKISNLEGWQRSQNGKINAVDHKIDSLKTWIMTQTAGIIVALLVLLYQASR